MFCDEDGILQDFFDDVLSICVFWRYYAKVIADVAVLE